MIRASTKKQGKKRKRKQKPEQKLPQPPRRTAKDNIDKGYLIDMILHNVPRALKDEFKAACYKRGYSMVGKIQAMMQDFINGDVQ